MSLLAIVGLALLLISGIWLLILSFQTSILWGLACLFIPFVSLIFVVMHWDDAKKPFLISLAGTVLVVIARTHSSPVS